MVLTIGRDYRAAVVEATYSAAVTRTERVGLFRVPRRERVHCENAFSEGSSGSSPIPVAERSTARAYDKPLVGTAGSNPAGGMDVCLL